MRVGERQKHNMPARKKRQRFWILPRDVNSAAIERVVDQLASPCEPEREADERGRSARHVEKAVVDRSGARRHEALVVLVEERDDGDEREGDEQPSSAERYAKRRSEGARGEKREQS